MLQQTTYLISKQILSLHFAISSVRQRTRHRIRSLQSLKALMQCVVISSKNTHIVASGTNKAGILFFLLHFWTRLVKNRFMKAL